MPTLIDHVRSFWSAPEPVEAPDGSVHMLKSGRWVLHQTIPAESFVPALLLTAADSSLYGRASEQIVLASTRVGEHDVELLLWASTPTAVGLGLRIPTAVNQYIEPYLLMEAEPGNSVEDAVREINFHLVGPGRAAQADLERVDWRKFFEAAAKKLEDLRRLP